MKRILFFTAFALLTVFGTKASVTINSLVATQSVTSVNLSFYINPGCNNGAMIVYEYSTNSGFTPATTSSNTIMVNSAGTRSVILYNLTPNTTYYWRVSGSNTCTSITTSVNGNTFTTLTTDKPLISSITTTAGVFTTTVNYSLNANGLNSTSVINYGLSSASLTTQVSAASATGTGWQSATTQLSSLQANTTYFYQIVATNSLGNTSSTVGSFNTLSPQPPTIASNTVTPNTTNSATVNYTLNANGLAATSVINYGTSASNLNQQVVGSNTNGTVGINANATLTGLTIGTTYFYQIVASNSAGSASSTVASFTQTDPTTAFAEYNFNNTTNNIVGTNPFSTNSGTSFVIDRNGNSSGAFQIVNTGATATIPSLPAGATPRTISFWVKMNVIDSSYNYFYSYGSNQYLVYFNPSTVYHYETSVNHATTTSTLINIWYHFVFSYDGTNSRIYRNGVLLSTQAASFNTNTTNQLFRLGLTGLGGVGYFNGAIDDLKIYNRALTQTEITNLFNNNSLLSAQDFASKNLKATIYPNPANDLLNIQTENELKSIEIYSLLGQKIMTETQKQINVSGLSKGIYMVRIEDENGAVATQKLVKE